MRNEKIFRNKKNHISKKYIKIYSPWENQKKTEKLSTSPWSHNSEEAPRPLSSGVGGGPHYEAVSQSDYRIKKKTFFSQKFDIFLPCYLIAMSYSLNFVIYFILRAQHIFLLPYSLVLYLKFCYLLHFKRATYISTI